MIGDAQAAARGHPVSIFTSLSPAQRFVHLATTDEARRFRTAQEIISGLPMKRPGVDGLLSVALCGMDAGQLDLTLGSSARWILTGSTQESLAVDQAVCADLQLGETISSAALPSHLGGLIAASRVSGAPSSMLLWDLSQENSRFLVVNRKGVLAVQSCPVGLADIIQAIQAEGHLESPERATTSWLKGSVNFSSIGPRVAKRLAPKLRTALTLIGGPHAAFFCPGLTRESAWLETELAQLLSLDLWKPSLPSLARELGLEISDAALEGKIDSQAIGLLQLASARNANPATWCPGWQMLSGPVAPPLAEISRPTLQEDTSDDASEDDQIEESSASKCTPRAHTVETSPHSAVKSDASPVLPPRGKPGRAPSHPRSGQPSPAKPSTPRRTDIKAMLASSGSGASSTPLAPPASSSAISPTAPLPEKNEPALEDSINFQGARHRHRSEPGAPRRGKALLLAIAGVFAGLALALGWIAHTSRQSEAEAVSRQILAEQRAAEALARTLAQEATAYHELERVKEHAQREQEKAIAAARQQTEAEILRQVEAERQANAPGVLIVRTEPKGAHVSIDGAMPQAAPLNLSHLSIGSHHLAISLPGYETTTRTIEIKRGQTTDLGLVELRRQIGGIEVLSEPEGLQFEVRPVNARPEEKALRRGVTPATVKDLPVGDYVITLHREGWKPLTTQATVASLSLTPVVPLYTSGQVHITSVPEGATVMSGETSLGVTPLLLPEVTPGELIYDLVLSGHDTLRIRGRVAAGGEVELTGTLKRFEQILQSTDISVAPVAIKTLLPEVLFAGADLSGEALLSCMIDTRGVPQSIQVEHASNEALGAACVAALKQWRFSPAKNKAGKTTTMRVTVPFQVPAK